jgi:flavin-dependent dehydrogenase
MYRVVPVALERFCLRKDNAFLIGEAAGFISASSLEGISYASTAQRSWPVCCMLNR